MKGHWVFLGLLSMPACGNGDGPPSPGPPPLEDGPGAFDPAFQTSPAFVSKMSGPRVGISSSPHEIVQIFYSKNIESALGQSSFEALPQGSLAVKIQSRDGDTVIDQVMVMLKKPSGTDPERADWIWEQRRPNTFELVSSSETDTDFRDFCAGCHATFPATDWLAGTALAD